MSESNQDTHVPGIGTEGVLKDYGAIGKYRIRLIHNPKRPDLPPVLDLREYLSTETFEGYTRRGCRFSSLAQLDLLLGTLQKVRDEWPEKKGDAPCTSS